MIVSGYNYIAVFLTFNCDNDCPYCINHMDGLVKRSICSSSKWAELFNSMEIKEDVPITLQGGEPTIYPEFYELMKSVDYKNKTFNLMTNLNFDVEDFMSNISKDVFNRKAPFPSIRVSYHIGQVSREKIINKTKILTDEGYNIGLYMLDYPGCKNEIEYVREKCEKIGVDFRTKSYLDRNIDPKNFLYHFDKEQKVQCKNSDLIISPDMKVFKCHYDLYQEKNPIMDLNQKYRVLSPAWYTCDYPNKCNPCDIKIKNNRYQQWGHCSVEIIPDENTNN